MNADYNFHKQLDYYASAKDPEDLAAKVLNIPNETLNLPKDKTAENVTKLLLDFLTNNANQIIRADTSNLKKVEDLAEWYTLYAGGIINNDTLCESLIKTVKASIVLAESNHVYALNPDSNESLEDIFEIIGSFNTFEDYENLKKFGIDNSPDVLKETIGNMKQEDVRQFIKEVRLLKISEPEIYKERINIFFKHSSTENQEIFFSSIRNENQLTEIISLLPQDLIHLNLSNCRYLTDTHVESLTKRLNKIETLLFKNNVDLTNKSFEIISKSPTMKNLKHLALVSLPLITDEAVVNISKSGHVNLQTLTLVGCTNLSDRGVEAIAKSNNMNMLQALSVSGTAITDEGVKVLATSTLLNEIAVLCFNDCKLLTDKAVDAIANHHDGNNFEANMPKLEFLFFIGCELLTDLSLKSIEESNNLDNLKNLFFSNCKNLTTSGLKALTESSKLPNLNYISIELCPNINQNEKTALIAAMKDRKNRHKR